jgi:hypothetical protein
MHGVFTLSAALLFLAVAVQIREQFAAVKGKLMCGAKPAESVVVRLYDRDVGESFLNMFLELKLMKCKI